MAYAYDEAQGIAFQQDVMSLYAEAGQALDLSNVVWSNRMTWDARDLGYPASRYKHLQELRNALNLSSPPTTGFDPSTVALSALARVRGSMWTARLDVDYGPRPRQADNILALEYIYVYPPDEQRRMIEAYKSRGYTHCCIGPINAQSYHGQYPDVSFEDNFDAYLDVLQMFWDNGLIPINFIKGDAWSTQDLINHEHLFTTDRAQRLMRVVVPGGWEPDRNTPSTTWHEWLEWGARVFPNALRLLHMVSDHDAPGASSENADNAYLWSNVIDFLHGWLVQADAFKDPTANFQNWKDSYDIRVRGSYPDRFHNGYAGWPTHSAWGNSPLKVYAGEYAAYWCYWDNRPESEARSWGDEAMKRNADGYLDGGTVDVP